jgi:hypothetical protein
MSRTKPRLKERSTPSPPPQARRCQKRRGLTPARLTLLTAALVLAGLTGWGWYGARRAHVQVQVEFPAPVVEPPVRAAAPPAPPAALPTGEVAQLAARVREATGLLWGLSVLALTEELQQRPATAARLVSLLAQRNSLPPGLQRTSTPTVLASDAAWLTVRYQATPLALEIVSLGRRPADGPPLLVRLDSAAPEVSGAVLLVAQRGAVVPPAQAFVPLAAFAPRDWRREPLRAGALTPAEQEVLHAWAQQYR